MIITNGTISVKTKSGGELLDGNPTHPVVSYMRPIDCYVQLNGERSIGVTPEGNNFTAVSYEILIDNQPFEATTVRLNYQGGDMGEFVVVSKEYLSAIDAIKIIV